MLEFSLSPLRPVGTEGGQLKYGQIAENAQKVQVTPWQLSLTESNYQRLESVIFPARRWNHFAAPTILWLNSAPSAPYPQVLQTQNILGRMRVVFIRHVSGLDILTNQTTGCAIS